MIMRKSKLLRFICFTLVLALIMPMMPKMEVNALGIGDVNVLKNLSIYWNDLGDQGRYYNKFDKVENEYVVKWESDRSALKVISDDAYDKDLNDWNLNRSEQINHWVKGLGNDTNKGYQDFIVLIRDNLKAKKNGALLSFNPEKTYNTTSFTKDVTDFACGNSSAESVYSIYKKVAISNDSDGNFFTFVACDANVDTGLFYYYIVNTRRYHGIGLNDDDDELSTFVFSSTQFLEPEIYCDDDDENLVHENNRITSIYLDTSDDEIQLNLLNFIQALLNKSSSESTMYDSILNNSVNTNDKIALNLIKELLVYETLGYANGDAIDDKDNIRTRYNGAIKIETSEIILDLEVSKYDSKFSEPFTIQLGEPNLQLFGDPDQFITVDSSNSNISNSSKLISEIVCEYIRVIATRITNKEKISDMKNNVLACCGEDTIFYDMLVKYEAVLNAYAELAELETVNSESTVVPVENLNEYTIITTLIKWNIDAVANKRTGTGLIELENRNIMIFFNKDENLTNSRMGDIKNGDVKNGKTYYNFWTQYWNSDKITDLQRSILATAYRSKLEAIGEEYSPSGLDYLLNNTIIGSYYIPQDINEIIVNNRVIDETKELVNKYSESDLTYTGNAVNIARVSNVAMHYAVVSSILGSSSDSNTIFDIYNANLDIMTSIAFHYTDEVGGQKDWFPTFPSDIGLFTGDKYHQLLTLNTWENIVTTLYNIEYALTICEDSETGQRFELTSDKVDEHVESMLSKLNQISSIDDIKKMTTTEVMSLDFMGDETIINMIRCIIELHDMCEFLEIDSSDWPGVIGEYLRIYDKNKEFFDALRKHEDIYSVLDVGSATTQEPLGKFFNIENKEMSDQWVKGFALSSLYVPMETNLYKSESISFMEDPDWVSDFYYKYAFYRKALYVTTDSSAVVNEFVSGDKSGTKVATLGDLLNYDRDIIIYVDDNFYNADEIAETIDSISYADLMKESDGSVLDNMTLSFGTSLDLNSDVVLKNGATAYYHDSLNSKVTQLTDLPEEDGTMEVKPHDIYLLSADEILGNPDNKTSSYLDEFEYSTKQSYAVVSAVYRDAELYNACLRGLISDNAIFKSSKAIASTPGATPNHWRSVYNYYMLANLEKQLRSDVTTTLDLDAPIFCDLFGNIITESGLVIIPAAANATLSGEDWTPYTVGFAELYSNGMVIEDGIYTDEFYSWLMGQDYHDYLHYNPEDTSTEVVEVKKENGGGYFIMNKDGEFLLRTSSVTCNGLTAIIQWDCINKNSTIVKQLLYNWNYFNNGAHRYNSRIVNLVVEVLRGAPIEYIDFNKENITTDRDVSKFGIYMAYKFDEVLNSVMPNTNGSKTGGNSVVTMPDINFMEGVEVYMLYFYKAMFAIMVVALAVSLYMEATQGKLGIRSLVKFFVTCAAVILSFTIVPTLTNWSYYNANKSLLSEEVADVMLLNYVKDLDGAEIGITSIRTPESSTELYLKVGEVDFRWWDIVGEVLFNSTIETVSDLYEQELSTNSMANANGVISKADTLYVNVQDIYDSTAINYSVSNKVLTNAAVSYAQGTQTQTDTVASFVVPYYMFLDQLVTNINEYNVEKGVSSLSWSVGSNGHVLTYDVVTPYLTSAEFLEEGYDILGISHLYREHTMESPQIMPLDNWILSDNPEKLAQTKSSYWYDDNLSGAELDSKINELYDYARDYIILNHNYIGRIPDEVFLKVFAMQLSIKYNEIFESDMATAIEIMNIDTRDLLRFIVASPEKVYKNYSYSYSRFVYEEAGGIGVLLSAVLVIFISITSFIKPLLMVALLALLIINCLGRKLLLNRESKCVEGYLIGCSCLVAVNYIYAFALNITMNIASTGLGSAIAIIAAILVQIGYIVLMALVLIIELKDWKNNGFTDFKNIGSVVVTNVSHVMHGFKEKLLMTTNESYADTARQREHNRRFGGSGRTYDEMMDRAYERRENASNNIN